MAPALKRVVCHNRPSSFVADMSGGVATDARRGPRYHPRAGAKLRATLSSAVFSQRRRSYPFCAPNSALQANLDYLDEVRRVDVIQVDGVRRDPSRVGRTIASLARNVATHASATTIAADASGVDGSVDRDTVSDYLNALGRLMIVEEQSTWSPHLRSRSVLRSAPKHHFVDPSLALAALRAGPDRLLRDLNLLGLAFESMVVRDLRVHAQAPSGRVLQHRDNTGLEVDAVVETSNDRWAAFEVKLGAGLVDEGADSLLRFADRIDTERCGPPAVLGVIVGTGYGYVRPDGIAVVPIGSLGP